MLTIKTSRPILENPSEDDYSNARGDSRDGFVTKEDRLFSESSKSTRKSARQQASDEKKAVKEDLQKGNITRQLYRQEKRAIRKRKRNATKLQILKRFSKDKKPLFVYRLKKLVRNASGKSEKIMPDGSTVEVAEKNQVTTPQGVFDKTEILKALGITEENFTANQTAILNKLIALETSSKTQQEAIEALKTNPNADLAVQVADDNISQSGDDFFITDETQDVKETETKDVKEEDKEKQGMSTATKIIIFASSVIVLGLIGYIIYNSRKTKI